MFDALPPGAAIFGDYRTLHRGTANRSPEPRPLLMHVYGREWWSDAVNYGVRLEHPLCMLHVCHASTDGLTGRLTDCWPQLHILSSFSLKGWMLLRHSRA